MLEHARDAGHDRLNVLGAIEALRHGRGLLVELAAHLEQLGQAAGLSRERVLMRGQEVLAPGGGDHREARQIHPVDLAEALEDDLIGHAQVLEQQADIGLRPRLHGHVDGRIEGEAVAGEGAGAAAGAVGLLQDDDVQPDSGQQGCGAEPGQARADHDRIVAGAHASRPVLAGAGAVQSRVIPAQIHLVASTPIRLTRWPTSIMPERQA